MKTKNTQYYNISSFHLIRESRFIIPEFNCIGVLADRRVRGVGRMVQVGTIAVLAGRNFPVDGYRILLHLRS